LKVIQVPFCFYPDTVGGTEIYVASLACLLKDEHGCDVLIAAPGGRSEDYTHQDLRVRRFAVSNAVAEVSELYGEGDELAAREFEKILDQERPDVVHLHAFTYGVSLKIVRAAKARKIPVVFTYHTATVTCTRGTMMRWGHIPCDGEMLGRRCTACTLHGLGVNRLVAMGLASMPRRGRETLAKTKKSGGIWTALRMRELVERRHRVTRGLLAEVDHIVAVCEWVRDVLLRNGVPANKITLCRQGITMSEELATASSPVGEQGAKSKGNLTSDVRDLTSDARTRIALPAQFTRERPLRLIYLGRLDPPKGLHVLIEALRLDKSLPVRIEIYGSAQGEGGAAYADRLQKLAMGDGRVEFKASVPSEEVISTMRRYDAVVVPSQWLETGPLVVLEAFAAGVPVIASDLGGIAELITNGLNGFLVNPSRAEAWYKTLKRLCADTSALRTLYPSIARPPTMSSVAQTMIGLYQKLPVPLHAST
jgi:glycosyltransferase involved in cell wall biosynthesis